MSWYVPVVSSIIVHFNSVHKYITLLMPSNMMYLKSLDNTLHFITTILISCAVFLLKPTNLKIEE